VRQCNGSKPQDIEVSLQDDALVISGERTVEKVEDGVEVHRQERCQGKITSSRDKKLRELFIQRETQPSVALAAARFV
jgi:HSP20 family molecular chaperone IbpA